MASKSWIPAVGFCLLVWALPSCARNDPVLETGPETQVANDDSACREDEKELSDEEWAEIVKEMEQIDPEEFEARLKAFQPINEALSEYFNEMQVQMTRQKRHGTFTAFQTNAATVPLYLGTLEDSGHDMSRERSCGQLVPAKLVIEPDCRPTWFFFCWRDPKLELLSKYRQDAAGWVKANTP